MSSEEVIKNLYYVLCNASINKNVNKLNEILSDDYTRVKIEYEKK